MKVNIIVTVDEDDWADEYGLDREDVRGDVVSYLKTHLSGTIVPLKVQVTD